MHLRRAFIRITDSQTGPFEASNASLSRSTEFVVRNNAIEVDLDTYARINPFPRFQNLENGVNKFLRFLFVIIRSPSILLRLPEHSCPFSS